MDLNLAKTFLTVVYGGSFVQAAERLCVSQTTVTARIKNLEEQLGIQLFLRSGGGVSLTPAGERFIPQAQQLLTIWEDALRSASATEGSEPLRIGTEISLWQPWLTHWLGVLRTGQPELKLQLVMGQCAELLDRLEAGQLDILLSHQARYRPFLQVRLLMEEVLIKIRNAQQPGPLIHTDWGEAFRQQFELAFPGQQIRVETNVGQLALQMLLEQGGTGYFRSQVVAPWLAGGQLVRVEGAPEFSLPVYLLVSQHCEHSQLQVALHTLEQTVRQPQSQYGSVVAGVGTWHGSGHSEK